MSKSVDENTRKYEPLNPQFGDNSQNIDFEVKQLMIINSYLSTIEKNSDRKNLYTKIIQLADESCFKI